MRITFKMIPRSRRGGRLGPAVVCALVLVFATSTVDAETTIYVGKHFEVRKHDAPVKYVFNANTRVARVTSSLSTNERIQRLRLRAGWNLVSLAVTAPNFLEQLREITSGPAPVLKTLFRWRPATRDYRTIASGESVAAGTVLWALVQTDAVVAVRGEYGEPSQWGAQNGETFLAVPALEAQPLTVPPGVTIWRYDAQSGRWQAGLTGDLASVSDLPSTLAPGEAIYIRSTQALDLGLPAPEERIRYYHQDHLGSSSVMTEATGKLVEETAFYPFGSQRHEHRIRPLEEAYKFTQKERDQESGFDYLEARFLSSLRGRFLTADPKYADLEDATPDPQQLNLYAYARNNPVLYADPTGHAPEVPELAQSPDEIDVDTTVEAVGNFLGSTWLGGMIKAPPKVKDAASFSGGAGDAIVDPLAAMGGVKTFGMGFGQFTRMAFGINNVDMSSQDYGGGSFLSTAIQFAIGVGEVKAAISGMSKVAPTQTGVIRSGAGRTSAPMTAQKTHEVSPRAFANTGSPPVPPKAPVGAPTGGATTIDPVRVAEAGAVANRQAILARHSGYIMANVEAYQSIHNTSVPIAIFEAFAKAADELFGNAARLLP